MAFPEQHPTGHQEAGETDVAAALAEIQRQLERNEENENPIERTQRQDELLERQAELEAELAALPPVGAKKVNR